MATRVDTRERMIEGARELVRRNGYQATSFRNVWDHAKTPRGSVYFHFPGGKEQLGLEVIERQVSVWLAFIDETALRSRTPQTFIARLAAGIADDLEASDFTLGCVVGAVAVEMSVGSPPLREAAAEGYVRWSEAIERGLLDKGVAPRRAGQVAGTFLAALVGALTISKTSRSRQPLDDAGKRLPGLLDSL